MGAIWEIDFYSRPLVDENQKKVWELLVCESPTTTQQSTAQLFRYAQYCPSDRVNSLWLGEALQTAMREADAAPQRIRFFRRQMNNMITKACKDIGIPSAASRRSIALRQWLDDRMEHFYPQQPNFQATTTTSVQMFSDPPKPLPEALIGEKWTFVNLAASQFADMSDWQIGFGEAFPLDMVKVAPETQIPGLIVYSPRSVPMAAWMSGLEIVAVRYQPAPKSTLLLETGASESWILARLEGTTQQEAARFEASKQQAKGVHFIAIQATPDSEEFAGFWLLYEES
ncbi:Tab2/Atab2 family RNA-binding protein [Chamaesiphon sp. VAR_69_metabat_338]|uniref:Tab2/Atab2 family RNA-binding protein n=1 Tax=Chamaesiphon sp. VAR_69_metabat_338 TaxID=2964704 RepID=UPI00286EAEC8|nr:Tab2/Atab2 family RNA-binding protein [Chamaesiphon sp. VAR_69_metabat_338]